MKGISLIRLSAEDVVRHRLVKEIIIAYDKADQERQARQEQKKLDRQNKSEEDGVEKSESISNV